MRILDVFQQFYLPVKVGGQLEIIRGSLKKKYYILILVS
jgi:hypothetical protein